uniref:Uncharacterized protein n=1 Tax=Physcomitrium patens TaxID=3218 RepID=A0A7I3Z7J7_PHYPA
MSAPIFISKEFLHTLTPRSKSPPLVSLRLHSSLPFGWCVGQEGLEIGWVHSMCRTLTKKKPFEMEESI